MGNNMRATALRAVSIFVLVLLAQSLLFSAPARAEGAPAVLRSVAAAVVYSNQAEAPAINGHGQRMLAPPAASSPQSQTDNLARGGPAELTAKGINQISLGAWSVAWGNGISNLAVNRISNNSSSRTTGTLQLRLLASTDSPALGQSVYAYTLSQYTSFNPLQPNFYYYDITRSSAFVPPPDGTYYIFLALYEYDTVNCGAGDNFCVVDLSVSTSTSTFGVPTPPPPSGRVTVVVTDTDSTSFCIEQYPAAAVQSLIAAGIQVTQYPSTTSCTAVGYLFRVGPLSYQGQIVDPITIIYALSADDAAAVCATGYVDCSALPPPPTAGNVVVEYYWATRDHYFISGNPPEIAALDSAPPGGWVRTGQTFKSVTPGSANASPVCRFYLSAAYGDSHYFSASPSECSAVHVKFPMFTYEAPNVFYMILPDLTTGVCPAGTMPVYRLWNARADTNHRYTTSLAIKSQMLALNYTSEGYGPNGVAMCATQ
jgi:hypothetical protein